VEGCHAVDVHTLTDVSTLLLASAAAFFEARMMTDLNSIDILR
jgi:hypothetical protein